MNNNFSNQEIEFRLLTLLINETLGFASINKILGAVDLENFTTISHKFLYTIINKNFNQYCQINKENNYQKSPVIAYTKVVENVKGSTEIDHDQKTILLDQLSRAQFLPDSVDYLNYYIEELNEQAKLRILSKTLHSALAYLQENNADDDASILANKIQDIMHQGLVSARQSVTDVKKLSYYATEALVKMDEFRKIGNTGISGVETGLKSLNTITNGLQDSDFVVIAARPSMGKSALAVHIAIEAAASKNAVSENFNYAVAFMTLEMPAIQLAQRFLANHADVKMQKIVTGKDLETSELSRLQNSVKQFRKLSLFVDDCSSNSIEHIRSKILRLSEKVSLRLVIIDYLQLMCSKDHSMNRQNEIAFISRTLKRLAVELNIPIIALSQLSREVEKRPDKRPIMSDLRESGAIEQDADIVMFLYRDDYYHHSNTTGSRDLSLVELRMAKHRNGGLGIFNLKFWKSFSKFIDQEENLQKSNDPLQ